MGYEPDEAVNSSGFRATDPILVVVPRIELPSNVEYVRTTPTFTEETVPAGLLGKHRVAVATWGLLTVRTGSLIFGFDEPDTDPAHNDVQDQRTLSEGDTQVIPPQRLHHLELIGPVTLHVAFYRITRNK